MLDLGYETNDQIKPKNIADKIKDAKLNKLCREYFELIKNTKYLNNQSKHVINKWGVEKLTPECMKTINYHVNLFGEEIFITDFMNEENEKSIESKIIEILDYTMTLAPIDKNPNRLYVKHCFNYPHDVNIIESELEIKIEDKYICTVEFIIKQNTLNEYVFEEVKMSINEDPKPFLYLSEINKTEPLIIKTCNYNKIDVYKDNTYIGNYIYKGKKLDYSHFKKYEYVKA